MIRLQPASRLRDVAIAIALLCACSTSACSSSVQDLGKDRPEDPATVGSSDHESTHDGFGAAWACPDSPVGRELACPLTRPIEGDGCPSRNSAPCSYVGEPASPPDLPDDRIPSPTTTFCICTRDLRWSCLAGVTMRTLEMPVADGDPCEDSLSIDLRGLKCVCDRGLTRCSR